MNDDLPAPSQSDELDWNHVIDKAWRPAWAIRSRHGCLAPFRAMLRDFWSSLRGSRR